ncbi:MAG: plasmid pRiA4b ORF-3 family protein [Leptolyngbyaceae cyanobacterium MO_188.B28]|nr:plasmid pRiA4b ORF-3 family protein [Leptolyngbyaceae cyanobacterium MO_188.B28]
MARMISVNRLIADARHLPRQVQEEAYAKGLIPYIPRNGKSTKVAKEGKTPVLQKKEQNGDVAASPDALYGLEVFLIDGPVSEEFIAENPQVSRTIEIKGDNTLKDLHKILFKAFDREEEHMYEFQVGGSRPNDPKARRYGLKQPFPDPFSAGKPVGDVASTPISSLGLSVGDVFGYWFDFGDDWWHQIDVMSITEKSGKGKYPKITGRVGASPPQYGDFE